MAYVPGLELMQVEATQGPAAVLRRAAGRKRWSIFPCMLMTEALPNTAWERDSTLHFMLGAD